MDAAGEMDELDQPVNDIGQQQQQQQQQQQERQSQDQVQQQQQQQQSSSLGPLNADAAQKERRNNIRDILADESLTDFEKRRNIQSLMDGRRRSSTATHSSSDSMTRAAAEASSYCTSDTEADDHMDNISISNHSSGGSLTGVVATAAYQYGEAAPHDGAQPQHQDQDQDEQHQQNHRRRGRSTSLPGWSEEGLHVVAPLAAAASGNANSIWDDPINVNRRMEKSRPACNHYERNCTIVSPCCGLAFGCRICHDECPMLPMPLAKRPHQATALSSEESSPTPPSRIHWADADTPKRKQEKRPSLPLGFDEEETHHEIDRFAIREIICRLCYVRQSSKTNFCNTCQAQFGAYHCDICNLWMSDEEFPYHCEMCGFCRVGGREHFRHCDDCGMCIDALLFDDHNCKAGKYMSNCPVCQEDLFSSRDASHEMPCGHAIHWHCFKELTSYDTRCPVCKKTAETPEHMAPTWQAMAMGIALQPVPPELARVVTITCNDCEGQDENRRWHFLGVRCLHCISFNTTVERTTLTGREAATFLDELDIVQDNSEGGENEHGDGTGASGPRAMDASE